MQYPEVLLSPHFPLVRKECKEQSAIFFHCLTTKSQMGNEYVSYFFYIINYLYYLQFTKKSGC